MDFKVTFTRDPGQSTEKSVCNLDDKGVQDAALTVEQPQFQPRHGKPPRVRFRLPVNDATEDLVEGDDVEIALSDGKTSFDDGGVFLGIIETKEVDGDRYVITCLGNLQLDTLQKKFPTAGVIDA